MQERRRGPIPAAKSPGSVHDEVKRRVIYTATKKYDNRQRRRRFGLIGDCLSTLVTRYRGSQVERLSFTLHYPKLESLSALRALLFRARFRLIAVADPQLSVLIDCPMILINVTVAAVVNYCCVRAEFFGRFSPVSHATAI